MTLILSLAYNITLIYVNSEIEQRFDNKTYDNCSKIWSSRGLYASHADQNSLKSINNAFSNGFLGVEIDFYYDVLMNKFIISHNKPSIDENGTLHYTMKEGRILTLEELFIKQGKNHYFWLDYKNLDRLSSEETQKSIHRLDKITQAYNLKNRVYIEGSTTKLIPYAKSGFKTILAFSALPEESIFTSISSNVLKMIYYYSNISAVAMPYGDIENPKYNETTEENLRGIPTFLFHVPDDKALLKKLVQKENVRVILVGRDKSVNRSNIMCENKK